ncbi:MAG TPA: hypothetical protein VKM93_05925 [Terriglobia bacterium]|nr:hypothetical protein [Terriglobia bacterium]
MMNSKGLLATQGERHATLSVSFGRPKWDEGYLLIPRGLSAKLRKTTGEGLLNLKGLTKDVSIEQSGDLLAFCRATETRRCQAIDSTMVDGKSSGENKQRLAQSKGVANRVLPSRRAIYSGLVGRLKRGEADLLIQQGLSPDLLRRTREASLNLKDLLTLLQPSGGATLSGFVGRARRGAADLLILQALSASLRRRTGEGLAQSKGLTDCASNAP